MDEKKSEPYVVPDDLKQAQMCMRIVPGQPKPPNQNSAAGKCESCGVDIWVQVREDGKTRRGVGPDGVIRETVIPNSELSPICGPCAFKITTALGDHAQAAQIRAIVEHSEGIIV